jgi:hypothetical protein
MIVGFLIFFAFAALVLGVVLLSTDLYGNSTPNYTGLPIIIFIMVLIGVLALIGGVILSIIRR